VSRQARVTAAYATVRCADPGTGKVMVLGFGHDAVFPVTADPEGVERLVRRGYAEWVDQPEAEPIAEPAEEPTKEFVEEPLEPPAQNAPKADWVAYAVTQRAEGVSEQDATAEAEAMTKADLIAAYGG
jgi:hypothetical protein